MSDEWSVMSDQWWVMLYDLKISYWWIGERDDYVNCGNDFVSRGDKNVSCGDQEPGLLEPRTKTRRIMNYELWLIGDIDIGAALCFPLKFCCSERSKFIFVCIFYAWTFLGLKRGRFLKICSDSNLKMQLKLVYSIILNLKKHTQQEICHFLKLIQPMQQEFGVF